MKTRNDDEPILLTLLWSLLIIVLLLAWLPL